jgi:hypothetical protein
MNKICTSIEQSLKLIELGIDVNTADMYYPNRVSGHNYPLPIECKMGLPLLSQEIPAWSLAVLLQVLPLGIYDELDDRDYELEINMIDKMPRYVRLGDVYHSQFPYDFEKDTLLDNVVESIIWLNNNNYFEL